MMSVRQLTMGVYLMHLFSVNLLYLVFKEVILSHRVNLLKNYWFICLYSFFLISYHTLYCMNVLCHNSNYGKSHTCFNLGREDFLNIHTYTSVLTCMCVSVWGCKCVHIHVSVSLTWYHANSTKQTSPSYKRFFISDLLGKHVKPLRNITLFWNRYV